jgi:hypothetical protein
MIELPVNRLIVSGMKAVKDINLAEPASRFWVIPGKGGEPRWLIPNRAKLGLPALRQWAPYDLSSKLKWQLILGAYVVGQVHRLPGVVAAGLAPVEYTSWEGLWLKLGWREDCLPVPVLYVGTPGPTRKLVLTLVHPRSGQPEWVVKVPVGPEAGQAIVHEASILKQVAELDPDLAPALLSLRESEQVSVQEFVISRATDKTLTSKHIEWLLELRLHTPTGFPNLLEALTLEYETYFEKNVFPLTVQKKLREALKIITALQDFPVVCEHGDFVSWNIRIRPDGKMVLVDWEEARMNGWPMQDLFYFHFIWDFLANRPSSILGRIERCRFYDQYMRAFDLGVWDAKLLYQAFLLKFLAGKIAQGDSAVVEKAMRYLAC